MPKIIVFLSIKKIFKLQSSSGTVNIIQNDILHILNKECLNGVNLRGLHKILYCI